jgi:hypothetical protein
MIALLECDPKMIGCSGTLFNALTEYIRTHGYSLELVRAMEGWHASLHGTSAAMELRKKTGWLLWFEDIATIDDKACWSNGIRKDLRNATPVCAAAWRSLIENISFGGGEKPPQKWLRPAQAALETVGLEQFRHKLRDWFSAFRTGEPLRLSVTGRDILRNLMFYALLAEDPQVDEAVSWFANARWKTKKDQGYVAKVIPAFVYCLMRRSDEFAHQTLEVYNRNAQVPLAHWSYRMYEQLCQRLGRVPTMEPPGSPAPPDPTSILQRAMERFFTERGIKVEGDNILVTGVLDSYVLSLTEAGIRRLSDGRPVRIELDFPETAVAELRAVLDRTGVISPPQQKHYRLMMCAEVLTQDDEYRALIVADSST